MLDCESTESGFNKSENKRRHKLRSSYVTSILITKLTFAMFLLKLGTLSAAIFLFVSDGFVAFMHKNTFKEVNRSFCDYCACA